MNRSAAMNKRERSQLLLNHELLKGVLDSVCVCV